MDARTTNTRVNKKGEALRAINIWLPPELYEQIKEQSEKQYRSMASQALHLLILGLESSKVRD
jgi:hypothetical protein